MFAELTITLHSVITQELPTRNATKLNICELYLKQQIY